VLPAFVASAALLVGFAPAQSRAVPRPIQTPDHGVYCKSVSTFLTRNIGFGCWRPGSKYLDRQTGQYRYRMWVVFWVGTKVERTSISAERRYPTARVVRRSKPNGIYWKQHAYITYSLNRRKGEWGLDVSSGLDFSNDPIHGVFLTPTWVHVY
jgi:hypothetical protein